MESMQQLLGTACAMVIVRFPSSSAYQHGCALASYLRVTVPSVPIIDYQCTVGLPELPNLHSC